MLYCNVILKSRLITELRRGAIAHAQLLTMFLNDPRGTNLVAAWLTHLNDYGSQIWRIKLAITTFLLIPTNTQIDHFFGQPDTIYYANFSIGTSSIGLINKLGIALPISLAAVSKESWLRWA